jgi:hypothetical protein
MGCSCSIRTDKLSNQLQAPTASKIDLTVTEKTLPPVRSTSNRRAYTWIANRDFGSPKSPETFRRQRQKTQNLTWRNLPDSNIVSEKCEEEIKQPKTPVRSKQINSKARCYNRHFLKLSLYNVRPWSCYYCAKGNDLGSPYHCSICDFFICAYCYMWVTSNKKVLPKYIRCPEDHPLRVTPVKYVTEFYKSIKTANTPSCLSCGDDLLEYETVNHCRICKFDLCNACVLHIEEVKEKSTMKCSVNHPLIWQINTAQNGKGYTCCNCKQTFELLGSFGCKECEHHVCIRCSMADLSNFLKI